MGNVIKLGRSRKLVFAALVVAAGLVLLNLVAALVEWLPYGTRQVFGRPEGLYISADPGTRPQLKPGARLNGWLYEISINSLGFRGPELANPRPGNGLRVWCAGGSSTFDIYAPDDASTWPAQLRRLLQRALPQRTVEVINAGIPNEVLQGSLHDFVRHFPVVRPDVLVVYHGPNDLRSVADVKPQRPNELLERLSWFAFFRVIHQEGTRRLAPLDRYPGRQLSPPQLDRVAHEVRGLILAAEQRGTKVVLATHALRLSLVPTVNEAEASLSHDSDLLELPPMEVSRAMDAYNSLVERIALERNHTFADVRKAVPPTPMYWGDSTHFSAAGSRLAAQVMTRAVLQAVGSAN